jgi:Phosphoribosylformylglycinamidine (FGAM) synthase, synthetase domain
LTPPEGTGRAVALHAWLFGEDPGRYVVTAANSEAVLSRAAGAGVPAASIGVTGGLSLTVAGAGAISVAELQAAHESWLPGYMSA